MLRISTVLRHAGLFLAFACAGLLLTVAYQSHSLLLVLGLAALFILTFINPLLGLTAFFIITPLRMELLVLGRIYVLLSELALGICGAAWFANLCKDRRRPGLDLLMWALPFLLVVFVSGLFSSSFVHAAAHLLRNSKMFVALLMFADTFSVFASQKFSKYLLLSTFAAHLLFGMIQFFQMDGAQRIYTLFTHPNQYAAFLNLFLPFTFVSLFAARTIREKTFHAGLAVLASLTLFLTLSRGAMVAAATALYLVLVAHFWSKSGSLLRSAFFLPLPLVVLFTLFLRHGITDFSLENLKKVTIEDENLSGRLEGLSLGFKLWRQKPFWGSGPGQFDNKMAEITTSSTGLDIHLHNFYAQYLVDFGLAGIASFLLFISALTLTLARASRITARDIQVFPLAGLGIILALLVHSLFDVTIPSLGLQAGMGLGICTAYSTGTMRLSRSS